jgi:hypothetical protein
MDTHRVSFMNPELSAIEELEERIAFCRSEAQAPNLPRSQVLMMCAKVQAYTDAKDIFRRHQRPSRSA